MLNPVALAVLAVAALVAALVAITTMIRTDGVQTPRLADATPLPPSVETNTGKTPRAPRKLRIEYDPLDHRIPLAEVERRMSQFPAWSQAPTETAGLPDLNPVEPGPLHVIGDIPTLELAVIR